MISIDEKVFKKRRDAFSEERMIEKMKVVLIGEKRPFLKLLLYC